MGALQFFVAGKPQTAGSKTAVPMGARMGVIEAGSKESRLRKRTWRGDLRDAAMNALADPASGYAGVTSDPLAVTFVIVRRRPSSHMRSGRHAGVVKDSVATLLPVQRPDTLKVVRAAEDALTGVVWADDSQLVDHRLYKAFGDQVGLAPTVEGLLVRVGLSSHYSGPWLGDVERAAGAESTAPPLGSEPTDRPASGPLSASCPYPDAVT